MSDIPGDGAGAEMASEDEDPRVLSMGDREKIARWIGSKQKRSQCPVCDADEWVVGEHLLHGVPASRGGLILGGTNYPTAFLVCGNCAYTRHFMAVPMDLDFFKKGATGG